MYITRWDAGQIALHFRIFAQRIGGVLCFFIASASGLYGIGPSRRRPRRRNGVRRAELQHRTGGPLRCASRSQLAG
jgi:hypothetical protein